MMDEYTAKQGYIGVAKQLKPTCPLDKLSDTADRVERLAFTIESFNDRFYHGTGVEGASACVAVPSGYDGQLIRLSDAVDRLDSACQRLQTIG